MGVYSSFLRDRQRMTEIFPIYDGPLPVRHAGSFVLFFKVFLRAAVLKKQRTVPT